MESNTCQPPTTTADHDPVIVFITPDPKADPVNRLSAMVFAAMMLPDSAVLTDNRVNRAVQWATSE